MPTPTELPASASEYTTEVQAQRPISAASAFEVRDRELTLRPIGSVQDVLRVTPGLVLVQHSGGGKANQYFLRGFDVDHGTDLALSIDGIPINLVSHAHGQGYADTNFIIPEVVERVQISKGPYFASQGDFATAGAVNLVSRDDFPQSSVGAGFVGSPGHGRAGYRSLVIASPKLEGVKATFAAEVGRTNGPFDNPERWDRYKLYNKLTFKPTASSSLTFGHMGYAGNWRGMGQIPARAVANGTVSRWGTIDPDEGGNTARHQMFVSAKVQPSETSELRALAYGGRYRFNMFSNFTLFLNDATSGDEIEQVDRRTFYGAKVSYRKVHQVGRVTLDTTIGADARNDDSNVQLRRTAGRLPLATSRNNDVHASFFGAFLNEEITPASWVRLNLGGRADVFSFAVDDRLLPPGDPTAPTNGVGAAHQLSPKLNLIFTPLGRPGAHVDVYTNYGHGFHSNDVRGVFVQPAVTPLTRAIGKEIGARARLAKRWDLSAALWQLDLGSETIWVGDEGTTAVGAPTTRRGIELDARCEITSWLAADVDVTFTRSRFQQDTGNGGGLALAPRRTWTGGLSARRGLGAAGTGRAGLRAFGIGDRPASDDGVLVAEGFTQLDLHLGFRHRRFDLALDVENLLDGRYRSAQFATTSRLPGEPAVGSPAPGGFSCGTGRLAPPPGGGAPDGNFYGCEDVAFTPAYPVTVRAMATLFLD